MHIRISLSMSVKLGFKKLSVLVLRIAKRRSALLLPRFSSTCIKTDMNMRWTKKGSVFVRIYTWILTNANTHN